MPTTPLGYLAARSTIDLGRAAFFTTHDADLPTAKSQQIASDDLLPQFGYVGTRYNSRRILLLGINPGNGPRERRGIGDQIAIPPLERFVADKTPESFVAAQRAYRSVCEGWAVWGQQCDALLTAGGLDMEDIAYSNALPWRTASESAFGKTIERRAATLYAGPFIREINPNIIVAVGKKAAAILEHAGLLSPNVVVWNRARALKPAVIADRARAAQQFANLLSKT